MKLTKKQKKELRERGYKPNVAHLNLYPEDFMSDLDTWHQVCQCLHIDPADVPWRGGVVIAHVGVKVEEPEKMEEC